MQKKERKFIHLLTLMQTCMNFVLWNKKDIYFCLYIESQRGLNQFFSTFVLQKEKIYRSGIILHCKAYSNLLAAGCKMFLQYYFHLQYIVRFTVLLFTVLLPFCHLQYSSVEFFIYLTTPPHIHPKKIGPISFSFRQIKLSLTNSI